MEIRLASNLETPTYLCLLSVGIRGLLCHTYLGWHGLSMVLYKVSVAQPLA